MGVKKRDFVGFTFNGIHSSSLNILRVSDGSRYNEDLLPSFQDRVESNGGRDGTYYWSADYKQKNLPINFAFDSLTEGQFRKLKQTFGTKELCPLTFDELPYKYYMTKASNSPTISYICFDEKGERVYKGEGSIPLVAYYPYAKSKIKDVFKLVLKPTEADVVPEELNPEETYYVKQEGMFKKVSAAEASLLDSYYKIPIEIRNIYPNIDEWVISAGMREMDVYDKIDQNEIKICTNGDQISDFIAYCTFTETSTPLDIDFALDVNSGILLSTAKNLLRLINVTPLAQLNQPKDEGILLNSKTNLIEGFRYKKVNSSDVQEEKLYYVTNTTSQKIEKVLGKIIKENPSLYTDIRSADIKDIIRSGNLYNQFIYSGDFFQIPTNRDFYFKVKVDSALPQGQLGVELNQFDYDFIYY